MKNRIAIAVALALATGTSFAAPVISRLTPPSELFSSGKSAPLIARFLPSQRFDLQATIRSDAGQTIVSAQFFIDGELVTTGVPALTTTGLVTTLPPGSAVASVRGYSTKRRGVHTLSVVARQSDGTAAEAKGNFEILPIDLDGQRVKNVIFMLGDGMGAAHRTAARIMLNGYTQGKVKQPLAMDTAPFTGVVMTASLNSIVTDSSPGMSSYMTGNKHANNQEGVFPDDTLDPFDNPRTEYLSQYMHRVFGTSLGIVTTADVFDATPAANTVYTSNRGAGTGIVDQFLDDRKLSGLRVLMGGGRKWFLPNAANVGSPQPVNGSQRRSTSDYVLPPEIVAAWGSAAGKVDPDRDLINDFRSKGFSYVSNASELSVAPDYKPLLGLFAYSNMNVALDKIGKRRGTSTVVDDYGFPDQPMLDEMTSKALEVLSNDRNGFVLMVEGASIDKQAHNMDSDRWMVETIEFDRAIRVARDYAAQHRDTLVIVTADHECSGAALIGASTVSNADLIDVANSGGGAASMRDSVVGTYDAAGFPKYIIASDGYPVTTDPDRKMLIGYGANADRNEDWLTNPLPLRDTQQPFVATSPLNAYPANPLKRDLTSGFLVVGQVPGETAVHTATDVPLSAFGRGASLFTGVFDNSDVFFKIGQLMLGGKPRNDDRD